MSISGKRLRRLLRPGHLLQGTGIITLAGPGFYVTLAEKLPVGIVHRASGHLQIFRKGSRMPGRRSPFPYAA